MLILSMSLCLWFSASPAAHAQIATVRVSPSSSSIGIDQTIDVNVEVEEVQNLYAAEFTLRFDPAVVEVLDIRVGGMLEGGTPIIRVDNEGGTVMFAATLLNPAPPVSGAGAIAELVLRGRANGGTVLSLEALLSDATGTALPARPRGGSINVGDVQMPTSTARPTSTPRLTPTPVSADPVQPTSTPAPAQPAQPTHTPPPPQANPTVPGGPPPTLEPQPAGTIAPPPQGGEQPVQPMPTWTIEIPTSAPIQPAPTDGDKPPVAPAVDGSPVPPATAIAGGTEPTAAAAATQQSAAGPVATGPADEEPAPEQEKGLPRNTFMVILAVLLSLVAILGVVVLISLSKWYQRGSET